MKATVFTGPNGVSVAEYVKEDPPPGWVRIGISAAGICGSDLHFLAAHSFPNQGMRPGHEVAGFVDAVGDGAAIDTGTHVTVEPLMGCGTCRPCNTRLPNRCRDFRIFGVTDPGGLAEYLNVPADTLHAMPADLESAVAALSEPMAVCCRGVRRGEVRFGDRVAILGAGAVGLLSIVAAKAAGASEVLVSARYPRQAELASLVGATRVFSSGAALLDAAGNEHIDVVMETVGGTANTLTEAVRVVRPGGRIVMLGIFDKKASLPGMEFAVRELTLTGSSCYANDSEVGDFAMATALVRRHRDVLAELVSHRFSLDQVRQAFHTAMDKSAGAIKVQVMPGRS